MTARLTTNNRRNTSAEATGQTDAEAYARDAERLLAACGVERSRAWISRTVRQFTLLAAPKGMPFGAYLLHRVELNAEQRRRAMANPDTQYLLCYADPTGETAVRNVMARA